MTNNSGLKLTGYNFILASNKPATAFAGSPNVYNAAAAGFSGSSTASNEVAYFGGFVPGAAPGNQFVFTGNLLINAATVGSGTGAVFALYQGGTFGAETNVKSAQAAVPASDVGAVEKSVFASRDDYFVGLAKLVK